MTMERVLDKRIEAIAWGLLLIWWGLRWWPLAFLPDGTGMLGTSLILLGVNAVRSLSGIPTRGFTTFLGLNALVWGVIALANSTLRLPIKLPVFEVLIILWGSALLWHTLLSNRHQSLGEVH